MTKYISEALKEFEELKNESERRSFLLNNKSRALVTLIYYAYSDHKKCKLSKKDLNEISKKSYSVPTEPIDLCPSNLFLEYKMIPYFFESEHGIAKPRLENFYIAARETLHQDEFKIFDNCLRQKQLAKYMTEKFIRGVFPNLLPKEKTDAE